MTHTIDHSFGHIFPTAAQAEILRASIMEGEAGVDAFLRWRSMVEIERPFDWEMSRLLPIVYHRLSLAGYSDPIMPRLKGVYRRFWAENTRTLHRATPIIQTLVDAGMDVMVLKGLPLGLAYFGNIALRPMSDVDVAVRGADFDAALSTLSSHGWLPTASVSMRKRRWFHALQLKHPDGGEFDLHWRVMVEATDPMHESTLWRHTETIVVGERQVRMLAPAAQLFHALLHGMRWNETSPVRWVTDSMQILSCRNVDWQGFVSLVKDFDASIRIELALTYLREQMGANISQEVIDQVNALPKGWRERLEAIVILADQRHWDTHFRFFYWRMLGDYARVAGAHVAPWRFAAEFPDYLCCMLGLRGKRELAALAARGVWRRISGRRTSTSLVAD